jgi:hypothetical protein
MLRIIITAGSQALSDGVRLMISATDGGTRCGVRELEPAQSITCDISPGGHTEIAYNHWTLKVGDTKEIRGTVVLSKTE